MSIPHRGGGNVKCQMLQQPGKTTFHGGQSRAWSAGQGKEDKIKGLAKSILVAKYWYNVRFYKDKLDAYHASPIPYFIILHGENTKVGFVVCGTATASFPPCVGCSRSEFSLKSLAGSLYL